MLDDRQVCTRPAVQITGTEMSNANQVERITISSENQHDWWKSSHLLSTATTGTSNPSDELEDSHDLQSLQPGDILFLSVRGKRLEVGIFYPSDGLLLSYHNRVE